MKIFTERACVVALFPFLEAIIISGKMLEPWLRRDNTGNLSNLPCSQIGTSFGEIRMEEEKNIKFPF